MSWIPNNFQNQVQIIPGLHCLPPNTRSWSPVCIHVAFSNCQCHELISCQKWCMQAPALGLYYTNFQWHLSACTQTHKLADKKEGHAWISTGKIFQGLKCGTFPRSLILVCADNNYQQSTNHTHHSKSREIDLYYCTSFIICRSMQVDSHASQPKQLLSRCSFNSFQNFCTETFSERFVVVWDFIKVRCVEIMDLSLSLIYVPPRHHVNQVFRWRKTARNMAKHPQGTAAVGLSSELKPISAECKGT